LLPLYPGVEHVRVRIVQPRGFHPAGPIREWSISVPDLCKWAEETLIPAMNRAQDSEDFDAGDWCRFCPAKLVCPVLQGMFAGAVLTPQDVIRDMNDEALGREFERIGPVKMYLKAIEAETFKRLTAGRDVYNTKLVASKANRVWKEGALEVLKAHFLDDELYERELKSVAQVEKISSEGARIVKEWAYTPSTGTSVALASDKRPAIKTRTVEEVFGKVLHGN